MNKTVDLEEFREQLSIVNSKLSLVVEALDKVNEQIHSLMFFGASNSALDLESMYDQIDKMRDQIFSIMEQNTKTIIECDNQLLNNQ